MPPPNLIFAPQRDSSNQIVTTAGGRAQVGTFTIQSVMNVVRNSAIGTQHRRDLTNFFTNFNRTTYSANAPNGSQSTRYLASGNVPGIYVPPSLITRADGTTFMSPPLFFVTNNAGSAIDIVNSIFGPNPSPELIRRVSDTVASDTTSPNSIVTLILDPITVGTTPVNPFTGGGGIGGGFAATEVNDDNYLLTQIQSAEGKARQDSAYVAAVAAGNTADVTRRLNYYRTTTVADWVEETAHHTLREFGFTDPTSGDYYGHVTLRNNRLDRAAINEIVLGYAGHIDAANYANIRAFVETQAAFGTATPESLAFREAGVRSMEMLKAYVKLHYLMNHPTQFTFREPEIDALVLGNAIRLRAGAPASSNDIDDYDIIEPTDQRPGLGNPSMIGNPLWSGPLARMTAALAATRRRGNIQHAPIAIPIPDATTGYSTFRDLDGNYIVVESANTRTIGVGVGRVTAFTDVTGGATVVGYARVADGLVYHKTTSDGVVTIIEQEGEPTKVKLADSPVGFDFADAGSVIGSVLGNHIAKNDVVAGVLLSASLKTFLTNVGEVLNAQFSTAEGTHVSISEIFHNFGEELLDNVAGGAVGAVSSYITGEILGAVGIGGLAGGLIQNQVNAVIGKIASNLLHLGDSIPNSAELVKWNTGINPAMLGSAAGSFIGSQLASAIVSFDTIGGQLGSAIGSSLGAIAASTLIDGAISAFVGTSLLGSTLIATFASAALTAGIGAFVGFIIGGLIGSVFAGTPRSGADVTWDEAKGEYVVANVYSRKGGSKDAASGMASAVAGTLNGVLGATGGFLVDPRAVQTGNYGMRKTDFVYRPYATRDKNAITQRFKGKGAAESLVEYGIFQALSDKDFRIVGGNVFYKRALYNTIASWGDASNFDSQVLMGNLASAEHYQAFLANRSWVSSLVAAEPDSVFAAQTALTLAKAVELGMMRRHESDWYGGYSLLLQETQTHAASVTFSLEDEGDGFKRWINFDDLYFGDTIDIGGQDVIAGTDGADTIRLSAAALAPTTATDNVDISLNGMPFDGQSFAISIAAVIDAGAGDDVVHASDRGDNVLGGAGNDILYGGRLDDWLFGGDGNDSLNAGGDGGTLGGDGNYLDGGAGTDILIGREGSDWLEGGDGSDTLEGGDGDDFLAGGAGVGDTLRGGRGDDQYLFRLGDVGSAAAIDADVVRDDSGLSVQTVVAQAYNDFTPAQVADFLDDALSGVLFRAGRGIDNWRGGGVQVNPVGQAAGGEDALVLGAGIGLEDVKLIKSADSADLIVELWPDGAFAGDRVVLKDWFTSFNKIETLKFEDGNEVRIADFDTFILGTDGSETIIGTAGNDFVHAGAGTDVIFLLSGNDFGNGGLGNDTVAGDSGSDIVLGADGDDTLHGGSGVDNVSGGRGDDSVHGDSGNDIVAGGAGNDEVIGGAGNDVFKFGRGDGQDIFIDALSDEWEVAWLSGPGWQNGYVLNANGTISHPTSGILFDGEQWLARTRYDVETGTLWRHKPASTSAIVVDSGADMIEFAIGIDINDIRIARANGDKDLVLAVELATSDILPFAALTDRITLKEWGPSGNPTALGSIEQFVFFNTGSLDVSTYRLDGGGDGDDILVGTAGTANWLTGGIGNDQLTGGALGDILNGNSGQDRLIGLGEGDFLLGGGGNDVLIGGAGGATHGDVLIGGDGLDVASYETATAAVKASLAQPRAATDASAGDAAGDTFDSIEGLRGSDFADELDGDSSENEFQGGKGNDALRGALGDDLYVFGRGDGQDSIEDQYVPAKDVVVDSGGNLERPWVARLDLMEREGGLYHFDHVVAHAETGEIAYRRPLAPTANRDLQMPTTFEAGGWALDDEGAAVFTGTGSGSEVADVAPVGPGGSDTLLFEDYTGLAGYTGEQTIGLSDLLFAFDTGANASDLLISLVGSPADQVRIKGFRNGAAANADSAIETIQFSDGSSIRLEGLRFDVNGVLLSASGDTIEDPVDSLIIGTAFDDALNGGYGNDSLSGLGGNDWLVGGDGDDQLSGGGGYDILHGGAGVDTVTYLGSDGGTGVTINLGNGSPGSGGEASGDNFNSIENVVGTHFNDTVTGDTKDNVLKGNRGNDTLTGGLGADVLIGDDGIDTLTGNVHDDALDGGAGNDVLNGGGDRDVLSGGEGNDILRGDGTSGMEAGGNLLVNFSFEDSGESADDAAQSYGLTTADLPGWTLGAARPVPLTTSASGLNPSLGSRALQLDDGADNVEISQTVSGYAARETVNLFLSSAGRTTDASSSFQVLWNDQIVLTVANGTSTWSTRSASLTSIEGDNKLTIRGTGDVDGLGALIDNVRLTRALGAADQLVGGAGIDRIEGGYGNDTLLGGDGNDNSTQVVTGATMGGLYGGAGDDLLDGGAGDDTLDGGSDADRYVFRAGSGNDTVLTGGGADELVFDGLTWDSLWFSQPASTQDLLITAVGGGASVRVSNWFSGTTYRARRIVAGGKMLSRFDLQALMSAMVTESAAVPGSWPASPSQGLIDALAAAWQDEATYVDRAVVTGTAGNDYLFSETYFIGTERFDVWVGPVRYEGLGGDDFIEAGGGGGVLIGGAGNDTMFGGVGNDEFRFGADPGWDSVDGSDGDDVLVATVNSARINLQSLANVERISGGGFSDVQVVVASDMSLNLTAVELEGVAQIVGSAGYETITGSAGADRILGEAGEDTLVGGAGDDWIQGGDGVDHHDGGLGVDMLDQSFSVSDQSIDLDVGEVLADSFLELALNFENALGGTGNDAIIGTSTANRLDGNGGVDLLDGGSGDDLLIGGAGGDTVKGGAGSDTASYETQAAASTTTSTADGVTLDGVVIDLAVNSSANGTTPPGVLNRAKQGDAAGDWFYQIENLVGSSFNDKLSGGAGDNQLTGGGGRDLLYGGSGDDTAVYAGNRDEYEIVSGSLHTVRDLNAADGDEGLDDLHDIEHIRFADMVVDLGIDPNNAPYLGTPAMADQLWNDGVTTIYQVPATAFLDLDNDPLTFAASLANGAALPSWLGWNAQTRTFSGAAPFAAIGAILEVRVTASDASASISDTFLLSVGEAPGADIVGTSGADTLVGTVRAETMIGLAGNDVLQGSPGGDRLDGGADVDRADYSGSNAAVVINLGAGTASGGHAEGDELISIEKALGSAYGDTITGSDDANELFGGAGADTIDGSGGDDLIDGGAGVDSLSGGVGHDSFHTVALASGLLEDSILGGTGNDTIYLSASLHGAQIDLAAASASLESIEHVTGSGEADTISGNESGNILSGGLGDDILAGAGGIDTLSGGGGIDTIRGGDGSDFLYGDEGDDWLQGGAGGDTFYGGGGIDTADYRTSIGGVTVNLSGGTASGGDAAGDSFAGGQVENIDATDAVDILIGTTTDNVMKGFGGNDTIDGGAGHDQIEGGDGDDTLTGGTGDDDLSGEAGVDTLRGDAGVDTLSGGTGNDTLYGGSEDDVLTGEDGGDILYGEAGTDNLSGGLGDDTLEGGLGLDTVTGGDGNDVIVLAPDALDTVDGGVGIDTASYAAFVGALTIDLASSTDNLTNIENLTGGSAGDILTGSTLANLLRGGGGGDIMSGGAAGDTLYGDAGIDTLRGDGGVDALYGGTENDTLYGGSEDDVLSGEDGSDILQGEDGADNLSGGLGNDTLEGGLGLDTVTGGDGDDVVILATDALDTVDGGAGIDTASYAAFAGALTIDLASSTDNLTNVENVTGGSGADTLYGSTLANRLDGGTGNDTLEGRGGADILVGGSGIDTVTYATSLAGAGFSTGSVGGSVINGVTLVTAVTRTLTGVDVNLVAGTGANADATGDTLSGVENLIGSDLGDRLRGWSSGGTVGGGLGDDLIYGGAGNDVLHGDGGHDILYGEAGVDSLYGDDGDDRLFGGAGNSALYGGDGNDTLGEEAGGGQDVFDGGAGDDTLFGSVGADSYDGGIGNDSISFRASAAAVRVNLSAAAVNGVAANSGAGGDAEGDSYASETIEQMGGSAFNDELTGGASWNIFGGGGGDDIMIGGGGTDGLYGEAGNDTLRGDAGADTLVGGTENDTLYGGTENDVLTGDDGNDTLSGEAGIDNLSGGLGDDDFHLLVVGEDTVDGGAGVDRALFTASAAALVIDLNLAAHKLTGIEEVLSGSGNDDIKGSSGVNRLDGGAGNDTLEGRAGADILVGGSGIDTVTYAGSLAGANFSSGSIGGSVINGVTLVTAVTRTLNGVDVSLAAGTGANADAAGDTFSGVENLIGSALADRLRGSDSNTTVSGGVGDDVIYGGGGNDTLYGDAGHDILYGEAGIDSLHGGDGDDRLFGGAGASSLYGGAGNDTLGEESGGGQDLFDGGAGDDLLLGGAAGDTYDGGTGIDTLDFRASAGAVRVNLSSVAVNGVAANRGSGGDADLDTYVAGSIENVTGSASNDELSGNASANIFRGGAGVDVLSGGAGNDMLYGEAGNDSFDGGAGADLFDGGADTDTVSYAASAAGTPVNSAPVGAISMPGYTLAARTISLNGVRVDMGASTGAGGDAAGDTFASIEDLIGSANHDQLSGTAGINRIWGGAGDDLIYGGGDNDELFGEAGADVIYGQDGQDKLWGGAGDDRLFGEGDPDELRGEAGDDILDAGNEGDRLYGGDDDDILIGGDGGDTYYYDADQGADIIHNYDGTPEARDVVDFGSIQNTNLWFTKVDNDLLISVLGSTTDSVTIADWFTNSLPGQWGAQDPFFVDMFIAGEWVEREVNLPTLLEIMENVPKPQAFADLTPTLRAQIEGSWEFNTIPTVTASAANQPSTIEGSPIVLRYTVSDNESAASGLSLTAAIHDQIGPIPVFQTILASDIVLESQSGNSATYRVTIRPVPDSHGESTIRITGSDGLFTTPLDVNIRLLAQGDPIYVSAPVVASGNTGTTIMLPGSLGALAGMPAGQLAVISDFNSEVFDYVRIEAVPVGAVVSDGTNSFTSAAGATTATITNWNLAAVRITPPAGSAADFTMTLRARSKENLQAFEIAPGLQFGPENSTTLQVNVNGTPTAVTLAYDTPRFNENVAGAIVGTLGNVDSGDPTGVYTYKIVGGAAAAKFVDPNDAAGVTQLRLAAGQSLDYEAGDALITVRVTDRTIASSPVTFQQTVAVRPADVNEQPGPPTDSNAAANAVNENVAAGTGTGITILAIDPEAAPLTYSLTADQYGWFAINATTGVVTVRTGAAVNSEATNGTATISAQVSDGVTAAVTISNIVINIGDVNETPTISSATSANMFENVAAGTVVSTIISTDPDRDNLAIGEAGHAYTIVGGTGSSLFEIAGTQVRTKAGTSFNYEGGTTSYTLTLRVTDGGGLNSTQNFTVNLLNVNEAPTPLTDSNAAANAVTEGATAGAATGVTLASTDPDGTALTYSITSDPYNWFAVNATTGVVTVRTGATVDYETTANGTATIGVRATDGVNAVTSSVVINIADVNETPSFTSAVSASIAETAAAGTAVVTPVATDPDRDTFAHGEAGLVYSIVGGTGTALFELVSGQVRTKSGATFDYDAGPRSYTLTLRARDTNNTGLYADQNFTVNITDVNEAPSGLTDSNAAANVVAEGATGGAGTGVTLWAADPENGLTYSITNNPFSWFYINPTTGVVTVRDTVTIDYETTTNGTVAVNVQATDNVNPVLTLTSLVISVTDVNETPTFTSASSATLSETAVGGAFVANLAASDPDRDTFANGEAGMVYSATGVGTGVALFEVVSGQIRTKSGAAFDWDAGPRSYTLEVRARDTNNTGLYANQTFTINISPVDEAPSVPAAITDRYVNENAAFSVALSGSVDPESLEVDYEFNLATGGNPGGLFAIDNVAGNGGTLRLISPVNFEAISGQPYYTAETAHRGYVDVRILAKDPAVNKSAERAVRIHFDNVNDIAPAAPVVSAWGTTTFNENSGAGAVVATFTAPSDGDGTLNALSYQLTTNPGGMFEIVGNQVRVITTAHFNYEAFQTGGPSTQLGIGLRTTDGVHFSGTYSFNVQLNNVDDILPVGGGFVMQNGYSTTLTENTVTPLNGLVVARAFASDGDGDALTYSIVGGNTANTFAVDASGNISAPNGINYEGMGGAANVGTDGNLVVNLVVRAAQSNNGGRYVDQTLTLNIADLPEAFTIYDGSGMGDTVATSPTYTTASFASGFAGARMWVGGNINTGSGLYWRNVILRDSNGDGQYTLGTDQSLFDRNENGGAVFTATGYRWESAIPATGPIPNGIRFIQDLPPIVLDLNGDGQFSANITVSFDVDGDGTRDRVGWIGTGDAFLVLDRNHNGLIDGGAEISFLSDKPGALSDLDGLSAYDSNQDGRFDASDARFGEFAVWQDADQDGVSDAGELKTLAAAGLLSLDLAGIPNSEATPDTASHVLLGRSTFTRANGETGQLGDLALRWTNGVPASSAQPAAMPLPADSAIAIDRDGNGIIDPLTEIAGTAFALSAYDSNGDSLISPLDSAYYDLRLWGDTNDNQRAEPDEVASLDRVGLTAISTSAVPDPSPATPLQAAEPVTGVPAMAAGREDERRFRAMLSGLNGLRGPDRIDALVEAAGAAEAGSAHHSRIVQAMASFGARGAAETRLRDPVSPHVFSLHAAS